jgi:hypothetical protein
MNESVNVRRLREDMTRGPRIHDYYNLEQQLEISINYDRIRNVNCGSLRRIGKTTTLKNLIRSFKNENWDVTTVLLIPRNSHREIYNDISQSIDVIETPSEFIRNMGRGQQIAVFADEVPNAEILVNQNQNGRINFVAGFYSVPPRSSRVFNPPQSQIEDLRRQVDNALVDPNYSIVSDHSFLDVSLVTDLQGVTEVTDEELRKKHVTRKMINENLKQIKKLQELKNNKLKFIARNK